MLQKAQSAQKSNEEATALEKIQVEVAGSYGLDGKINLEQLKTNLGNLNIPNEDIIPTIENEKETFPVKVQINGESIFIKQDGKINKIISIPPMTDYTLPYGEVKGSQYYDETTKPWCAFTGVWTQECIDANGKDVSYYQNNHCWVTKNNTTLYPAWIQYKFPDYKITPLSFEYMSSYSWGRGCQHRIKIQGSNDENTWTDLTEEIICNAFTKYEITPTKNITEYQYYRLNVLSRTETYGSRTDVLLFQVYGY